MSQITQSKDQRMKPGHRVRRKRHGRGHRIAAHLSVVLLLWITWIVMVSVMASPPDGALVVADQAVKKSLEPFWQDIPSAAFKFEMIPVPGDESKNVKPFWIGKTELTWEAFDVYVYGLDQPDANSGGIDAVTRPTKPYLPPDRGFGHEGFAAISLSHHHATEFCKWLSAKSGRKYRLPTEAEWEHACGGGNTSAFGFGDDASQLGDYAWFAGNANNAPHPVAAKKPNAWGLHDMHGNVAEWVDGRDGKPVVKGGTYRDAADKLKIAARVPNDPAWNASDPQIPKSQWWLADGPFIGLRVVCEVGELEDKQPQMNADEHR